MAAHELIVPPVKLNTKELEKIKMTSSFFTLKNGVKNRVFGTYFDYKSYFLALEHHPQRLLIELFQAVTLEFGDFLFEQFHALFFAVSLVD